MIEKIIDNGDTQFKLCYNIRTKFSGEYYDDVVVFVKEKKKRKWNKLYDFHSDYEFRRLNMNERDAFVVSYYKTNVPKFEETIMECRKEYIEGITNQIMSMPVSVVSNMC